MARLGEELGGVEASQINKLEKGQRELTHTWMLRLGAALNVPPTALIEEGPAGERVTVRGALQAGHWTDRPQWPEDDWYSVQIPDLPEWRNVPKEASEVRGPSMNLVYPEGSIVIWTPFSARPFKLKPEQRIVVRRERDGEYEITLKEYWVDGRDREWLRPRTDEPEMMEMLPISGGPNDRIEVLGLVIYGLKREG
jgi:transcriptional regulator with XRE-family HTH domain